MDPQGLHTDKLIPIALPETCAPRPELLARYGQAAGMRCVFVSAPAGCGKTVSTLLWLKESGRRAVWLGLDEYDNTPAAFYRFFCTALFSALPPEESLLRIVKGQSFNDSPVEYTIEVLSRLTWGEGCYALVFDDFHLITREEILKSLLYVIKRLPLSVTVLFLSRGELPGLFAPLAESGKVAFIGAPELAFKSDEIRRFFAGFGLFITAEEARELFQHTGGWAIAVSALALSGGVSAGAQSRGGLLDPYIRTQIWDKFDDELRRFMVKTSAVDEFSVELCRRLTQNPDAGQVLDMLYRGNLFISRQEDQHRYHSLFLDFLREEAAKDAKGGRGVLYRKAADYYLEQGNSFDALRYFIKSGDGKGMAAALYHFLEHSGQSSREMSKIQFINRLPAKILEENPFLYISCAYCAFLSGEAEDMYFYLDRLYERLHDLLQAHKVFLKSIMILITLDPRYSFKEQAAKFQPGPGPDAGPEPETGQELPQGLKSLNHNLPYFHRTFRDFSHYALNTEAHFVEFNLIFAALLGKDYKIIASGIRAGLLYEQNYLKEAIELLEPNPATDAATLAFLSQMQLAACFFALGREKEVVRYRTAIKDLIERENLLYLLPVFSAYETKIELIKGNKKAAAAWLDNYFVTEDYSPELHRLFLHFTTVRAYIVLGEFEKARQLCEVVRKQAVNFCRLLDTIEAAVLMTVLMWLTDKKQAAAALLQDTLADAEPYRFIRVFADEGKAILPILKRLLRESGNEDGRIPDHKYVRKVYQAAYEQSKRYQGLACAAGHKPVQLSKQQKYILELLARGYKNAEIVELTGLSINTIRSHTKTAYQKLEVNTAMDAVLRARELGLID